MHSLTHRFFFIRTGQRKPSLHRPLWPHLLRTLCEWSRRGTRLWSACLQSIFNDYFHIFSPQRFEEYAEPRPVNAVASKLWFMLTNDEQTGPMKRTPPTPNCITLQMSNEVSRPQNVLSSQFHTLMFSWDDDFIKNKYCSNQNTLHICTQPMRTCFVRGRQKYVMRCSLIPSIFETP